MLFTVAQTYLALAAKQLELAGAWDDSRATVPTRCIRRQKAMHSAIVLKCEQLLDKMAETGELPAAAERAGAAVTNFPVEDIFQMMRRLHDGRPVQCHAHRLSRGHAPCAEGTLPWRVAR